ncbi:MAG: bifunctional alpha/beta hydrolase/OsmC family protein, partial [Woeseiaceae bacterium]|nr:bifunctional alpha/beta hydrolase/OsmC family protein [Woeseiaceae bacterium]
MQNIKVQFENAEGRQLSGTLDMPKTPVAAYALFAHCFTCTHNLKAATNISRSLTDAGIAVLRFDFTGLGRSEGEFADTNFSSNVADLLAAVRFLENEYAAPSILLGHSLGGTAVLQAAASVPSAVAVATIGSPADPAHVQHLFGDARDELESSGQADVNIGGRPFTVKKQFLDDLEQHDLYAAVGKLRKALLIMHAPLDEIVEIDNAATLYAAAKHPKSFASLDRADHLLSNNADSLYAGRLLAAWASRYLPEQDLRDDTLSAEHGSVIAKTWSDGFYTEVAAGDHALVADEPASVGGGNRGPSPYELLSAALATCTTMTLKMYAGFKNIDLDAVTVKVVHKKMHAEACADCESGDGKIDEFRRELTIEGDVDEAQRQRMLEIADRCPVHQTLHGEVKVRT